MEKNRSSGLSVVAPAGKEDTASLLAPREQTHGDALPGMHYRRAAHQGVRVALSYESKGFSVHSNISGFYPKDTDKSSDSFQSKFSVLSFDWIKIEFGI